MQLLRDIKSIPVLRPLIGLTIGILLFKWIQIPMHFLLSGMFVALVFLLVIKVFRTTLKPGLSWLTGVAVNLFFICLGTMVISRFYLEIPKIQNESCEIWYGEVLTEPVVKNRFLRFEMLLQLDSIGEEKNRVQVIIRTEKRFDIPLPGQILVLKTKPEKIPCPQNPGEFNYAKYLESLEIRYRCFVKENEWKLLADPGKLSVNLLALKAKKKLWEKIENLETDNNNLGVLYALSLGSKDLLTPEIRESYSSTGAMHVLVVSGQHIALIWMVLSYIFIWLKDIKGGKYIQFFLITGLIWFYTFMTGVTASVVRASGMFTLVSLGKIIQKESSIYNSLSVSAFFLLLFNPQWLSDPGFQLSYLAVLSIVFFQPRISELWKPRLWLTEKVWEIASVSIAAQIGTLPLTLFYFNRFPPWFIISNIVVIPLVTLIMILFIIMLIFWAVPFIFSIFLKVILFLIEVMNTSLRFIEGLPSPGMDMIYLSGFQLLCFVAVIIGITMFIAYKQNHYIFMGLVSMFLLTASGSFRKYETMKKSEMVLFSVPGKMVLGLTQGNTGKFFHNAADTVDMKSNFDFKCKSFLLQNGIRKHELVSMNDSMAILEGFKKIPGNKNYYCRINGKSILILNDPAYFSGLKSSKILTSDIIIVNGKVPKIWKNQLPLFSAYQLLISSSPPKYVDFKSGQSAIVKADSTYDTRIMGAFRLSF